MIDIRVPIVKSVKGRVATLQEKFYDGVQIFYSPENPVRYETVSDPNALSRLDQGGEFDSFHNKSVSHAHVDVRGTLFPSDAEKRGFVPRVRLSDHYVFGIRPTFFRVNGYPCMSCFENYRIDMQWPRSSSGTAPYAASQVGLGGLLPISGETVPFFGFVNVHWSRAWRPSEYRVNMKVYPCIKSTGPSSYTIFSNEYRYCGFTSETPQNAVETFMQAQATLLGQAIAWYALQQAQKYQRTPMQLNAYSPETGDVSAAEARAKALAVGQKYMSIAVFAPFPTPDYSRIVGECVENNSAFTSNLLAYIGDLRSAGSTVRELFQTFGSPPTVRSAASSWLSAHYGDRLTVRDSIDLFSALQREVRRYIAGSSRGRSYYTEQMTRTYLGEEFSVTYQVAGCIILQQASHSPLMTAIKRLMDWDLWPSLENTWDMVPLSFVVDWFFNVSEFLSSLDTAIKIPYLRPLSQYRSLRLEMKLTNASDESAGLDVTLVKYDRRAKNLLGEYSPLDLRLEPNFSVANLLDGASLLVFHG